MFTKQALRGNKKIRCEFKRCFIEKVSAASTIFENVTMTRWRHCTSINKGVHTCYKNFFQWNDIIESSVLLSAAGLKRLFFILAC